MAKKKIVALDIAQIADKLYKIREEIAAFKDSMKPMEEKEEILRTQMLIALKENRMDTYRDEMVPLTFTRSYRSGLEVDLDKALPWAKENGCITIDKIKANQALKGSGALPDGFTYKETEYLSVRSV